MDWVISLVAVLVSLVTVVISYLMNRENLKHASKNMMTEHMMDFKVSVWNDVISLCDKLVQLTSIEHLERSVNLVVAEKMNDEREGNEERILATLQEESEQIRSCVFHLGTKASTLDDDATELLDGLRKYGSDVVSIYENLQKFCISDHPSQEQYDLIVEAVNGFETRNLNFSHGMQKYIMELHTEMFASHAQKEEK